MEHIRSWIVAIDLSERSHGAIRFAQWLRARSSADERLRGIHIASPAGVRRDHPETVFPLERARQLAFASVEALGATEAFQAIEVVRGDHPEQELEHFAVERFVDGVILGRAATIEGWSLISLGRVARRLLRVVPRPLVVVPPDLSVDTLGRGPIVVAVQPMDHCLPAARLGRSLAWSLDLPLAFVHVLPGPAAPAMASTDPAMAFAHMVAQEPEWPDPLEIETWAKTNGFGDVPLHVERGRSGPALLGFAEQHGATLLLCGSRRLSLVDRIFLSSTGSELAGKAGCPVVVVPPDEPR